MLLPGRVYRSRLPYKLSQFNRSDKAYILDRVNYYNKQDDAFKLKTGVSSIKQFKAHKKNTYFLDLFQHLAYFKPSYQIAYKFGDVVEVPEQPTFVKSRPISEQNKNSVILKLNRIRHFRFVNDQVPYEQKLDKLVWRGAAWQAHRKLFIRQFHDHRLCNVGQVNPVSESEVVDGQAPWVKEFMTIKEQLQYKFILCIEGNDVATNLKWAMSSNSLCFMTKPKFETWFMEGRLVPGYHYVQVKDDYSDLEQKLEYYIAHPEQAKQIVQNANQYVYQFKNHQREKVISLMVIDKYFDKSQQKRAA